MDTHCAICSEPWDIYGLTHGDVKAWEADSIQKGYGCPCCRANGFIPLSLYDEFEQYVSIGTCIDCNTHFNLDNEELHYDGSMKALYHGSGTIHIDNKEEVERFLTIEHDWKVIDENLLCASCADNYDRCDICGGTFYRDEIVFNQEDHTSCCEDCYSKEYGYCERCQETIRYDELKDYNYNYYCESCYSEAIAKCDICSEEFLKENETEGMNGEVCCSERCADKTTEEE